MKFKNGETIVRVCARKTPTERSMIHITVWRERRNLWGNIEIDCVYCLAEINQNIEQRFRLNDVYRL